MEDVEKKRGQILNMREVHPQLWAGLWKKKEVLGKKRGDHYAQKCVDTEEFPSVGLGKEIAEAREPERGS